MKRLIFTVGLGLAVFTANAQTTSPELVSSAGDSFNNTSYQLDWSIGELQTETYAGSQNTLTQGFHQGTYIITGIDENPLLKFSVTAFPNPASEFIMLKVKSEKFNEMQYTITDLSGKVLQTGKLLNETKQINFANYAVGTYFISVSQNDRRVQSFQVIKK
jgi:hypothetical protein